MGAVSQLPLPPQPQPSQQPHLDVAFIPMELHALASVAHANDASLASLEAALRSALQSAMADRAKLAEALSRSDALQNELRESRKKEQSLQKQLQQMKVQLETVEDAEERLALQLGELEAEAVEQAREQNALVKSLRSSLQEKEALLQASRVEIEALRLAKTPGAGGALEGRLAKADLFPRRGQSELRQSQRKAGKLQGNLDEYEDIRVRQEERTKRIQRGKEGGEVKKALLMGEAVGVKFWFKAPGSIIVGSKAVEA